jgi:hypothetical protein
MPKTIQAITANMSEQDYLNAVGEMPIDDDLERVNCPLINQIGHYHCGWNSCKNKPMFMSDNHNENCNCK